MRILVTGNQGQIARSLAECGPKEGHEIICLGRPALDLAADLNAVVAAIEAAEPDVVVSAAAYTAVDKAESEPDLAFAINQHGARAISVAARRLAVPLVHLSTDYVFDGLKDGPYREEDETGPATVYGASKLAGERAVLAEHGNSAILRTAWVFSPFGANFVKTMLRLAADRDCVSVVADQRGNPTSALEIANGILTVAARLTRSPDSVLRGVFHMTCGGEATWTNFAEAIFDISGSAGGPSASVKPINTSDYPTFAKRPANSRLDCGKLELAYGIKLRNWQTALQEVVGRLTGEEGMLNS